MYYHSIIVLLLLNTVCYSLPIPYTEQNLRSSQSDEEHMISSNQNDQVIYHDLLCALYNDCYHSNTENVMSTSNYKPKRLTSNLFHGIPKFGKRAFVSAFSGIPKFG